MRVAYLGIKGLPAKGGAERVVEAITRRMPALGISPTVYCDEGSTPPDHSINGVELIRVPSIPGKHLRTTLLNLVSALDAIFLRQYDLIHLHNIEASYVLPLLRLKYKVVSTSHGFAYKRDKWSPLAKRFMHLMDRPFVKLSNVSTSVSLKNARDLGARFGHRVRYIPNGTGLEYVGDLNASNRLLEKHNLHPGRYLIFVAGRIIPTKGVHFAIEAVDRLADDIPLLIVGDETHSPEYSNKLRTMAGSQVRFQPLLTNPVELFGLMADARFLIFPSTVEAMSMVLLEAGHIGVPIVCSDIPENREVMGEAATYFQSANVDSLVERLQWALGNPADLLQRSQQAQKRVSEHFSWDAIATRYADLYHGAVQKKHSNALVKNP